MEVRRNELSEQLRSAREWDSFYGDVLASILPSDGAFAYLGETEWQSKSMFTGMEARLFAVSEPADATARALVTGGREAVRALGCAQEEGSFHRAEWRADESEAGGVRRVLLAASLYFGDYGGVATIDVHVVPDVLGATLVIACTYEPKAHGERCEALARAIQAGRPK